MHHRYEGPVLRLAPQVTPVTGELLADVTSKEYKEYKCGIEIVNAIDILERLPEPMMPMVIGNGGKGLSRIVGRSSLAGVLLWLLKGASKTTMWVLLSSDVDPNAFRIYQWPRLELSFRRSLGHFWKKLYSGAAPADEVSAGPCDLYAAIRALRNKQREALAPPPPDVSCKHEFPSIVEAPESSEPQAPDVPSEFVSIARMAAHMSWADIVDEEEEEEAAAAAGRS